MAVKNKLLQIRFRLGYKFQQDFAKYLELSQFQYNRYENNVSQPSLETMLKICGPDKLNMDPRRLFYIEEDIKN